MPASLEARGRGRPGSNMSLGEPVVASCRIMRTAVAVPRAEVPRAPGRSQKVRVRKISFLVPLDARLDYPGRDFISPGAIRQLSTRLCRADDRRARQTDRAMSDGVVDGKTSNPRKKL